MEIEVCELCGERSPLIYTVAVSADINPDECVKRSANVCAVCLFSHQSNEEIIIAVNERLIEMETDDDVYVDEL